MVKDTYIREHHVSQRKRVVFGAGVRGSHSLVCIYFWEGGHFFGLVWEVNSVFREIFVVAVITWLSLVLLLPLDFHG